MRWLRLAVTPVLFAATASLAGCTQKPPAPPAKLMFDTPATAGAALFDAAQKNDDAALLQVFGPDAKDLVSSGDAAEDKTSRENFVEKYQKMHRIGLDGENRTALIVGAENWPFPIPLVENGGKWSFDTDAGKNEVLYRRIGRNEASAERTCQELVAAQREYFAKTHDGDTTHQYAQHLVSTAGKHDGLFWEAVKGDDESPIGPLLAFANSEAEAKEAHTGPVPFQGYFFRMLRAQGASVPGGAKSYIVNGKMTGGFAFLAYPAEYRSSGVMTFIVGPDGVVSQKDLGPDTTTQAKAVTAFDVDTTWTHPE